MPLLSAAELAQLRVDINDLLPDDCRVERAAYSNIGGDTTETWGTAIASVDCRFDPDSRRSQEEIIAGREAGVSRYIVTFPYNTDVRDGDRLYFKSMYYQILELHSQHSLNGSVRLRVARIEGE